MVATAVTPGNSLWCSSMYKMSPNGALDRIGTGLYRLYWGSAMVVLTWAVVCPMSAASLPTTTGSWTAATRDRVICSVTTLLTRGLP